MLPHVKNQSALSFKNFENPEHTMRTRPLSYACLLFATLMSLLVVPCMYDLFSRRELRKVEETDLQPLDIR